MKKGLLIFLFLAVGLSGLKYGSALFFSVKEYRFVQTGSLSSDYFSGIKTYALDLFNTNHTIAAIITSLKKEFPLLNKIIVAYRPCGVYVMLYGREPLCSINDSQILTNDHHLFIKDQFSPDAINSIYHITVSPEYLLKSVTSIATLLGELSSEDKNSYDLAIMDEHRIRLTDKQDTNFNIISSMSQKKLSFLCAQSQVVKKNLIDRKVLNQQSTWVADIRFADYIIAYKV